MSYKGAWSANGATLAGDVATKAQREHLARLMRYLAAHRSQLDYPTGDIRGAADALTWHLTEDEAIAKLAAGGRLQFDCSQAVTQLCRWAGLSDPNGLDYRYPGYTGTLLAHLPHYSRPRSAMVGALPVFGPGTGEHVSMVLEPGADPGLWSHGRSGVDLPRLSQQRTWHRPPVTLLSIAHL